MTKHHAPTHHRNVRHEFLTPQQRLLDLRKAQRAKRAVQTALTITAINAYNAKHASPF